MCGQDVEWSHPARARLQKRLVVLRNDPISARSSKKNLREETEAFGECVNFGSTAFVVQGWQAHHRDDHVLLAKWNSNYRLVDLPFAVAPHELERNKAGRYRNSTIQSSRRMSFLQMEQCRRTSPYPLNAGRTPAQGTDEKSIDHDQMLVKSNFRYVATGLVNLLCTQHDDRIHSSQ